MGLKTLFQKTEPGMVGVLSIQDAYLRVGQVVSTKESASAFVEVYRVVGDDRHLIASKRYDFCVDLEGCNFIKQAYEHIKTLPEFAGAVDC